VAILDLDRVAGEQLARDLGRTHEFAYCDVTRTDDLRDAIEQVVARLSGVQILITNAADDTRHDAQTLTRDAWDASVALNLGHHFFAAQAVEPHLRAQGGGSIVCLGSTA